MRPDDAMTVGRDGRCVTRSRPFVYTLCNLDHVHVLNLSLRLAITSSAATSGWADSVNTSFFGEMLQSIADRSRALIMRERREPSHERSASLIELCEELLTGRGEASGVALAREILVQYAELTIGPRIAFFEALGAHVRSRPRPHRFRDCGVACVAR